MSQVIELYKYRDFCHSLSDADTLELNRLIHHPYLSIQELYTKYDLGEKLTELEIQYMQAYRFKNYGISENPSIRPLIPDDASIRYPKLGKSVFTETEKLKLKQLRTCDSYTLKRITIDYNQRVERLSRIERHFITQYAIKRGLVIYYFNNIRFFGLDNLDYIAKTEWQIPVESIQRISNKPKSLKKTKKN